MYIPLALLALTSAVPAFAAEGATVIITGTRPSSLPTQIPTTLESVTGQQIDERINASDAEDALKYLPSLTVRKRYIGDYNHAVLSTRASGTGNSARSMVYADGILLSNFLGNGAGFTPRWGMLAPEEVERVDVLYGPFSAAYPGNAAGAVVDYQTRMPSRFEAYARFGMTLQPYTLYSASGQAVARQGSVALGDRQGPWSWWLHLSRLHSVGQPMVVATRMLSEGVAPTTGATAVTGAVAGKNNKGQDWWILGTATRYDSAQDQAKLKLAYDLDAGLRASYTLGWWHNATSGSNDSFLRDGAGQPVYFGNVLIDGRQYKLDSPSLAFAANDNQLTHVMQGLSLKRVAKGGVDWELAASDYAYVRDLLRAPVAASGAGRITDQHGTGWQTLAARATLRAAGQVIEFGWQQDSFQLRTLVSSTGDWLHGPAGPRFSAFNGNTRLQSLWAQNTFAPAPQWKATLGARLERWQADGGELGNASTLLPFGAARDERSLSPKAALAYRVDQDWTWKASAGRAVRMPTVGELYQGSISGNRIINTDPGLRAERSWTSEWSAERMMADTSLRATLFFERTRDALYAQALSSTVNTVQNVGAIHTRGLELAWSGRDTGLSGLDTNASLTYADSVITENAGFPASVGKQQPRVPKWRAVLAATYQASDALSLTLGARYSGTQYGQLDSSDTNGFSYQGFSKFFVVDTRLRYRLDRHWSAALGVDNLNNYSYWAFHPYPKRSVTAELRYEH